eukprot:1157645-Pelagomonas_calceolata.AAC.4
MHLTPALLLSIHHCAVTVQPSADGTFFHARMCPAPGPQGKFALRPLAMTEDGALPTCSSALASESAVAFGAGTPMTA